MAYAKVFGAHALAYVGASVSDHDVSVPEVHGYVHSVCLRAEESASRWNTWSAQRFNEHDPTRTLPNRNQHIVPLVNRPQRISERVVVCGQTYGQPAIPPKARITANAPSEVIAFSVAGRLNVIVAMLSRMSTLTPGFILVVCGRGVLEVVD